MKIIGIDLGTSNTYLYAASYPGKSERGMLAMEQPGPIVIQGMSDDSGSIATVVLYENDRPMLAGNIAENEFYANIQAQHLRRLASQFKPEISQGSPDSMRAMTDFLALLRAALPEGFLESDSGIYVGIPSLAREDFSINMAQCFISSGWPRPKFVRESDAALISCLQSGTLDIDDVERKCVIVDFGGGTCDYTTVESMYVLQNGGDMLYGGRLFDDLFFQVFMRHDKDFAALVPTSPYEWYVHWIECKTQKEQFSNHLGSLAPDEAPDEKGMSLHAVWYADSGQRHDSFVEAYTRDDFVRDAENYAASTQMLRILKDYVHKGGLSRHAEDLLEGRQVGLISWLGAVLDNIGNRRDVARVVLTGGSSRWPFASEIVRRLFPQASIAHSRRSYEDIAYGLALFPVLASSRERVNALLNDKIAAFAQKAVNTAKKLMQKQAGEIVSLCSQRIATRDIMPALEAAQTQGMTVEQLEQTFSKNISQDQELVKIAEDKSRALQQDIQQELNFAFRAWLRQNGVLLAPNFTFPAQAIGQEFFDNVSIKISRLDSLQLMKFTLTTILPLVAATTTATTIAHTGEPVSSIVGGSMAFGATWLLAKTAPKLLEKRKLPAFLLNESNRKKIVDKNRAYIEKSLNAAMADAQERMEIEIERRLRNALSSMLGRLTVLNQVKTH